MRVVCATLSVGLFLIMLTPVASATGECIDDGSSSICVGDNTLQDGNCETGGYDVAWTGVMVRTDDLFLFVGGYEGCAYESRRSDFDSLGVDFVYEGQVNVNGRASYDHAVHHGEQTQEECSVRGSARASVLSGPWTVVEQQDECPAQIPVLPWGHLLGP